MKLATAGALLASALLTGCVVAPAPYPRERVVEREVVDDRGVVVERDHYIVNDPPPPAYVEVVPVAPYPGAVWARGYWYHGPHHRWAWTRGHWR